MLPATMVDVSFALRGASLPAEHRRVLTGALLARLPWLAEVPGAGVHRIRTSAGNDQRVLLSGRSRLMLRVPRARAEELAVLAGACLDVDGERIELTGPPSVRELLPHATLYAHAVQAPGSSEIEFLAAIDAELDAMRVSCRRICGRARGLLHVAAGQSSFGLMLDQLGAEDALTVLQAGLGGHRLYGCGLFVPHKSAAAVGL